MAAGERRHAVGDQGRVGRAPVRQRVEQPRPFEAVAGLDHLPVLAFERLKLDVEIFEQLPALCMEERPGAEAGDMFGVAAPARRAARRVQRDEAFEQMLLPIGRAGGDLALEIAAMRQPPAFLQRVAELLGDGEQLAALEAREREQMDRNHLAGTERRRQRRPTPSSPASVTTSAASSNGCYIMRLLLLFLPPSTRTTPPTRERAFFFLHGRLNSGFAGANTYIACSVVLVERLLNAELEIVPNPETPSPFLFPPKKFTPRSRPALRSTSRKRTFSNTCCEGATVIALMTGVSFPARVEATSTARVAATAPWDRSGNRRRFSRLQKD